MRSLRTHRGITTWLALVGYVLVASGLPLPLGVLPVAPGSALESAAAKRLAGKDRSRAFPCMDKPCGCATAAQCFTRCCCNTPAETLAWARAHAVEPAVLAALELRAGAVAAVPVASTSSAGCCETKARPSCCAAKSVAAGDTALVCGDDAARLPAVAALPSAERNLASAEQNLAAESALDFAPPAAEHPPRSRGVSLRAMLACGGLVAEWFAAGVSLPPPAPERAEILVVVERRTCVDWPAAGLRAAPDAPPPRAA